MKGILISLYDSKAETWTQPTCSPSRAAAIRDFDVLVNDSNKSSVVSLHPEDFTLFELGTFDSGCISGNAANVRLASALELKRVKE